MDSMAARASAIEGLKMPVSANTIFLRRSKRAAMADHCSAVGRTSSFISRPWCRYDHLRSASQMSSSGSSRKVPP